MSWDEYWSRFRRRGFPFFFDKFFEDMDKMMEEMFKEVMGDVPKNLVRERRTKEGGIIREMGPFVYGYSMTIGPDGKPVIREFGNIKPSLRHSPFGLPKPGVKVREEREPLVDTIEEEDVVKVVAELPGVEKTDIQLQCEEKATTISVTNERRKYYKEIPLPAQVDPDSAKASYKNGVLEVVLTKVRKAKGKPLKIE